MQEPKKYVDMVVEANNYADKKIKEDDSICWVKTRDSRLMNLCFIEIQLHLIKPKLNLDDLN